MLSKVKIFPFKSFESEESFSKVLHQRNTIVLQEVPEGHETFSKVPECHTGFVALLQGSGMFQEVPKESTRFHELP